MMKRLFLPTWSRYLYEISLRRMNGCLEFIKGENEEGYREEKEQEARREAEARGRMHNDTSVSSKIVPEYFCMLQRTCQTHDATQREQLPCAT